MNRARVVCVALGAAVLTVGIPATVSSCSSSSNPGALGTNMGTPNEGGVVDGTILDSGTARDTGSALADSMGAVDSGEGPECGAGLIACNGVACVDLMSNPNNCGTCFNVCSGSGMTISCCDAACVDNTSDPKNCGACGVVCEAGTTCVANVCQ